jgi:hypothetical protein
VLIPAVFAAGALAGITELKADTRLGCPRARNRSARLGAVLALTAALTLRGAFALVALGGGSGRGWVRPIPVAECAHHSVAVLLEPLTLDELVHRPQKEVVASVRVPRFHAIIVGNFDRHGRGVAELSKEKGFKHFYGHLRLQTLQNMLPTGDESFQGIALELHSQHVCN